LTKKIEIQQHYKGLRTEPGLEDLLNDTVFYYKPYFENPDSIIQIFHDLEEENLYLIFTNQVGPPHPEPRERVRRPHPPNERPQEQLQ
jgi:hypothetical protein